MRRTADLQPGEAKADARDAAVIADTARTMPPRALAGETDDITDEIYGGPPPPGAARG